MRATVDSDVGCAPGKGVIGTSNGELFDVLNPQPENIHPFVISAALSQLNRFCGHARFPYSVSQHSDLCATECERRYPGDLDAARACLLHDAAEAYCGDIARPIKQVIRPLYSPIEASLQAAIWKRFGIEINERLLGIIEEIDTALLVAEAKQLMKRVEDWGLPEVRPAMVTIVYVPWYSAHVNFMEHCRKLGIA